MKSNRKALIAVLVGIILVVFVGFGIEKKPEVSQSANETETSAAGVQLAEQNSEDRDESETEEAEDESEIESQADESTDSSQEDSKEKNSKEKDSKEKDSKEESSKKSASVENEAQSKQADKSHTGTAKGKSSQKKTEKSKTTTSSSQRKRKKDNQAKETTTTQKPNKGSQSTSKENSQPKVETVNVVVDFSSIGKGTLSFKPAYTDGMTAMGATTKALREQGLSYEVRGSGAAGYMVSITNIGEFDYGAMSGWLIEVDGVHINKSADATKVKPNSQVYWHYTTDYTKE